MPLQKGVSLHPPMHDNTRETTLKLKVGGGVGGRSGSKQTDPHMHVPIRHLRDDILRNKHRQSNPKSSTNARFGNERRSG